MTKQPTAPRPAPNVFRWTEELPRDLFLKVCRKAKIDPNSKGALSRAIRIGWEDYAGPVEKAARAK